MKSPPPKKKGCAQFLMIIIVIIVAVVAWYAIQYLGPMIGSALGGGAAAGTAGAAAASTAATALTNLAGYAIAGAIVGAAASVVTQGFAIALGLQDKFSWKAVAAGAISGAFSGAAQGIGVLAQAGKLGELAQHAKIASAALKVMSVTSRQLIENGKITSWTSLAVAGVGGYFDTQAQMEFKEGVDKAAAVGVMSREGLQRAGQAASAATRDLANIATYASPWVHLAETAMRNDGKLKAADWAGAVGATLGMAMAGGELGGELLKGFEPNAQKLITNLFVGGAISAIGKDAGKDYLIQAAAQWAGEYIGHGIGSSVFSPIPTPLELAMASIGPIEGEHSVDGYAKVRQGRVEEIKKLGSLPVDENALYLEPEKIEELAEAAKNGRSIRVDETLQAFIQLTGIDGKTRLVGSSRGGYRSYYESETVKEIADFLTQLGGDKLPVAIGFGRPGATSEDAYRSMLDYVGGYISDDTRYQMYSDAASKRTGLFKYSDAGLVDLTRGLQESFSYIDTTLTERGYISQRGYGSFQRALSVGDAGALAIHERPQYEDTIARARLHAYYADDLAPARLRDGAREAAKAETFGILIAGGIELAAVAPWARIGRIFSSGVDAVAGSMSRLGSLLLRSRQIEGELSALTARPGQGLLANRKQMRDFFNEAERLGYTVRIDESAIRASVNPRTKEVTLRSDKSELSTLVDEYSHMWNKSHGRGNYLPEDLAKIHRQMGGKGTTGFNEVENTLFHQLELANMWFSGVDKLPSFVRAVPRDAIRSFINETRDIARSLGKL